MYSRPIKIYQGIDNPVQILVKNQDQKPVDINGYSIQVDIQDPENAVTAYSFAANATAMYSNLTIGTTTIIIDKNTVNALEQRFYKITVKLIKIADGKELPLYIDDNFGVPLDLEVLPAYYSNTVTVENVEESVIDPGILP